MRKIFWTLFAIQFFAVPVMAKGRKPLATPAPIPTPSPETQIGDGGQILFFPEIKDRPPEGRHPVQSGQMVSVCAKINPEDLSFYKQLIMSSIGYRIILEDQSTPPKRLIAISGNRLVPVVVDDQGCLNGTFQIPFSTKNGVYQVSDFLIAETDQSYYSLREKLYAFSLADELKVDNPGEDNEAPQLVSIQNFKDANNAMKADSGIIKLKVDQIMTFADNSGKVDPKAIQVYYKLWVDDQLIGLQAGQCRKTHPHRRIRCRVIVANPQVDWGLRKVALELHSLQLKDPAGNELFIQDPEVFRQKTIGGVTKFIFQAAKPWPVKVQYNLDQQKIEKK